MKHRHQKELGEERAYLVYVSSSMLTTEGCHDKNSNRAGTWTQEVMWRPLRSAAYWHAPHGLLSLLFYTQNLGQISTGMAPPTKGCALLYQSLIKMPYRITYRLPLWGHFSIEVPSSMMNLAYSKLA